MVNSKHAFWLALVFTVIVFTIGLIFGYFIDKNRSEVVELNLLKSGIDFFDEQIRNDLILNSNVSCSIAKQSIFDFADRIYQEAKTLEKYDSNAKFTRILKIVHKRYDLMRVTLWSEGVFLKEECNLPIHTIVYFFNYDEQDFDIRAKQTAYAGVLTDFKEKYDSQVLLVPIATNLDISSVNLILEQHNITQFPSILVDEKIVVSDFKQLDDFENIVFNSNKE